MATKTSKSIQEKAHTVKEDTSEILKERTPEKTQITEEDVLKAVQETPEKARVIKESALDDSKEKVEELKVSEESYKEGMKKKFLHGKEWLRLFHAALYQNYVA